MMVRMVSLYLQAGTSYLCHPMLSCPMLPIAALRFDNQTGPLLTLRRGQFKNTGYVWATGYLVSKSDHCTGYGKNGAPNSPDAEMCLISYKHAVSEPDNNLNCICVTESINLALSQRSVGCLMIIKKKNHILLPLLMEHPTTIWHFFSDTFDDVPIDSERRMDRPL